MKTKMVLTAFGIATLLASPAFAQKPRAHVSAPVVSAAPVLSYEGRVIGADPDARVRFELQRDATIYSGNN